MILPEKLVKEHKIVMGLLAAAKDVDSNVGLFKKAISTGQNLAILYAEFKCEKCKSEKELTIHHIIDRRYRKFIKDFYKYEIQRRYWANLVVLCKTCHAEFHKIGADDMAVIPDAKLEELKKKYVGCEIKPKSKPSKLTVDKLKKVVMNDYEKPTPALW
jgi:Zn finger protein HypA/HybF involved in hydrogenase expression